MHQERKRILQSPFLYISSSTKTVLSVTICLLVPQLFMLFLTHSYASLFIILAAVLASLMAEALYHLKRKASSVRTLRLFFPWKFPRAPMKMRTSSLRTPSAFLTVRGLCLKTDKKAYT